VVLLLHSDGSVRVHESESEQHAPSAHVAGAQVVPKPANAAPVGQVVPEDSSVQASVVLSQHAPTG
jgi:hypothetical protein